MNQREKVLATVVGGLAGVFVLGFGFKAAILKPIKEKDKIIAAAKANFNKINGEKLQFFATEDRMKQAALKAFGESIDQASASSGEILTRRILQSGLEESEFMRLPAPPRRLKGAHELGWIIAGEGPLSNVVNLLFALDHSPYLHRVENIQINDGNAPGRVKVRFRYLTLTLDPAPEVELKPLADTLSLESPERRVYDDLVVRDILRPYIKRPPPPPAPPANPGRDGTAPAAPGPESYKVVSLSEWEGQQEIHVLDGTGQRTTRYRPGDELAGGAVVCIDYRPRPMKDRFALSESRVILKIGGDYFAIDRGRTLADKYKMEPDELPQDLANAAK